MSAFTQSKPTAKFNLFSTSTSSLDEQSPTHVLPISPSSTNTTNSSNHPPNHNHDSSKIDHRKYLSKLKFTPACCHKSPTSPSCLNYQTNPPQSSNFRFNKRFSSSDIFERSLMIQNDGNNLINKEIPDHFNLENYTSPILDSTTEILMDPKIKIDQVNINDYDDDEFDDETSKDGSDEENGKRIKPRPRSRSIISQNLFDTLRPHPNQRSNSYAGFTAHNPPPSSGSRADTIDFYSFADYLSHEE